MAGSEHKQPLNAGAATVRTFHRRADWRSVLTIVLLAVLSLAFLWQRQGAAVVVGFGLMLLTVIVMERLIHTTYVLTSDGYLVIDRGRLSRCVRIEVVAIHRVRRIRGMLFVPGCLVVEYGAGHQLTVVPDNEKAFADELKRRMLLAGTENKK